jgi:tight adherence protein C
MVFSIGTAMGIAASLVTVAWAFAGSRAQAGAVAAYGAALRGHKLKTLVAVPANLLLRARYEPRIAYDRKVKMNIIECYGKPASDMRFLLHQATKVTYMGLAAVFCMMVGAATKIDAGYLFFCGMMLAGAFFVADSRLSRYAKKRRLDIMLDFPDFLVQLALLVNAGMNVNKAWEHVSGGTDKRRALGMELEFAAREIRSGKSEAKAYEDFAKRCRMPEVTRVVSVLLQNVKKGNAELVSILRVHANECWEMRKNAAKKLGEEASSKMLLPMAVMLISILMIVAAPAILALQGAV